jgi:hypothetical protein
MAPFLESPYSTITTTGGTIVIWSEMPLKKIGEGREGEAIFRTRVAALIEIWSMRPLLDTENHERGGEGVRVQNGLSVQSSKLAKLETRRDSRILNETFI